MEEKALPSAFSLFLFPQGWPGPGRLVPTRETHKRPSFSWYKQLWEQRGNSIEDIMISLEEDSLPPR